jgi:hypothetical protein
MRSHLQHIESLLDFVRINSSCNRNNPILMSSVIERLAKGLTEKGIVLIICRSSLTGDRIPE